MHDWRTTRTRHKKCRKRKIVKLCTRCMLFLNFALGIHCILISICSPQVSSALFFQHNTALVPRKFNYPQGVWAIANKFVAYNVLVDTNFLSHTVQRKLPLLESMMDLLYAKCKPAFLKVFGRSKKGKLTLSYAGIPIITSCVMAELVWNALAPVLLVVYWYAHRKNSVLSTASHYK